METKKSKNIAASVWRLCSVKYSLGMDEFKKVEMRRKITQRRGGHTRQQMKLTHVRGLVKDHGCFR